MSPVSAAGATCMSVSRQIRPTRSASIGGRSWNARCSAAPESPGAARGVASTKCQSSGRGCWKITGGRLRPVGPAARRRRRPRTGGRHRSRALRSRRPRRRCPSAAPGRAAAPARGSRLDRPAARVAASGHGQRELGARPEPRVRRDRLDHAHGDGVRRPDPGPRRLPGIDAPNRLGRRGRAAPAGAGRPPPCTAAARA